MRIDEEGTPCCQRPPGRPFRFGIRVQDRRFHRRAAMVAPAVVDILGTCRSKRPGRERGTRESRGAGFPRCARRGDFVDMNQDVINRAEDGSFRTKHLVRGGGEVYLHAVYHGDRLHHPLHERHAPPGGQRAGRLSNRRRWRPSTPTRTAGVLARRGRRTTARGCSVTWSRCT